MIDKQAEPILKATNAAPPLNVIGIAEARRLIAGRPRLSTTHVAAVRDLTAGRSGVPARLYHPTPGEIVPLVVFAHGGGWAVGSIESADETCRRICQASGCAVLSLDYRLAPEFPHPAAVEDVVDVVEWLPTAGFGLGADTGRIAVAGESSGAQVAAAAAIALRDAGITRLACQLLVCPPLDRRLASASWSRLGEGYIPSHQQMAWFWNLYLGADNEHAAGLLDPATTALGDLPPAIVVVAEYDPLRDEALDFAQRLRAAGVATEVVECAGQLHAVFGHAPVVAEAARYLDLSARKLGDLLRRATTEN